MNSLEYQFEVELRKGIAHPKTMLVKTERMPYEVALGLSDKLNRMGLHYTIVETDTRCGNYRQLTSRMLHILSKNQR